MVQQTSTILPLAPVERIIRNAGAKRVSESAGRKLASVLEEIGLEISNEAITLAEHARRATVREEDVTLAIARLKKYNPLLKSISR